MLFIKLAFRNLFASKRRSLLTILLTVASTALLIFYMALMNGQYAQLIKDTVELYTGYVQIKGKGYKENPDYDHLIFDVQKIEQELKKFSDIETVSVRFETFVLFSSGENSIGGQLVGVLPTEEAKVTRFDDVLSVGQYLENSDTNAIYIGSLLAQKLDVKVGDTFSFISNAIDRSMAADNVIVKGIFKTGVNDMDGFFALMHKTYMDELFLSDNAASSMVLLPEDVDKSKMLANALQKRLLLEDIEIYDWRALLEGLLQAIEVDKAFAYVLVGMFFIVVFFVIMIYSYIAIYARIRELGIMRAIGTNPLQILAILLYESVILGFIAGLIGTIAGGVLVWYFNVNPIEFTMYSGTEEQMGDFGYAYDMTIATAFDLLSIAKCFIFVWFVNVFAVLFPALKILRLKPIEAIRS